jgi:hypothetical protein
MGIHNQPEGVGIISGFFVGHILRWNIIPPGPGFGAETLMDIAMINGDIMQYIYIYIVSTLQKKSP